MRKLSFMAISLVGFAYGANENNNTEQQNLLTASSPSIKENAKTATQDFLQNLSTKGFMFARYISIDGEGGSGQSQQYRGKIDVTTGKVNGYSLTGGILFSQGSSAIDAGRSTDGDVQGSRGIASSDNFADRFNVAQLYASKEIKTSSLKAKFDVGRMNINSLLTDKNLDLGLGANAKIQHELADKAEIGYQVSFYDSWMTDHVNYNVRRRQPKTAGNTPASLSNQQAAAIGIGNNLSMLHVSGKNLVGGLHFNAVLANVWRLFDFMTLGDVGYKFKFGSHELGVLGQFAFAGMNENPHIFVGWRGSPVNTNLYREFREFSAKYRGVYNLQVNYEWDLLSAKFGFLGSFADGYAVLLSHKSGINTAGKVWNGNLTATYDGLGVFGSGSFRGSSLGMLYVAAQYKLPFDFDLNVGLDVSYFFGDNHFPVLDATRPKKPIINNLAASQGGTISGGKTSFINAKFVEIAPSISYTLVKNLNASFTCTVFAGDISFVKTQTELRWVF